MNNPPIYSHIKLYREQTASWLTAVLPMPCMENDFENVCLWAEHEFCGWELQEFLTGYCDETV